MKVTLVAIVLAIGLSAAAGASASDKHGDWMQRVPEKERTRPNPLAQDDAAVEAGGQIFASHCASCHGTKAEGKGRRPNLHSDRVRQATDGELQWLLRNGSLAAGMPSWSGLPEVQRWQLIRYLHSLARAPVE